MLQKVLNYVHEKRKLHVETYRNVTLLALPVMRSLLSDRHYDRSISDLFVKYYESVLLYYLRRQNVMQCFKSNAEYPGYNTANVDPVYLKMCLMPNGMHQLQISTAVYISRKHYISRIVSLI